MKSRGYFLVFLQFAGAILACFVAARSFPPPNYPGIAVAMLGVFVGFYTLGFNKVGNFNISPILKPDARLITSGPYRFVRHPMYLSVVLFLLGMAVQAGESTGWVGFLVSTTAMLGKAEMEEKILLEQFPQYVEYQRQTKKLLPFIY